MKLVLDDKRDFPAKTDCNCVRTYEQCIELIGLFKDEIDFISLDYDLDSEFNGLSVLTYLHDNNIVPKHINIHSDHPKGVELMINYVKENFRKIILTTNRL